MTTPPTYLAAHATTYATDPRTAALDWFRDAKFGLFLHYGLYSLLERHEWVQFRECIPVAEMAMVADDFTAEHFDAEAICQLALAAEMKYINLTTRHHDSFCLFETKETDFHVMNSPCGRDLVGELAAACDQHGLGLCLYYSHGRDWRHPHAPNNDRWGGSARPQYDPPEPTYAYGEDHDLSKYVDFMAAQITELLTNYGPIAAIWLDGIATPLNGPAEEFRCQELYDLVHSLQPQVLVSYKQGLLGTEDFFAPEHGLPDAKADDKQKGRLGTTDAPIEICTTMIEETIDGHTQRSWGHFKGRAHKTADRVWEDLTQARRGDANLLLNTGPLPDGSLDERDVAALTATGYRILAEGWPA